MWDRMAGKSEMTESRVRQLKEKYWKDLITLGSRVEKFQNTADNANLILARVCEGEKNRRLLHIQEELVELGKPIKETDASVTLYSTLQRLLKEQRETLDSLMREEGTQADPALLKSLADQRKQIEAQM
ncbi:hypothetical protein BJ165DRAFT_1534870 [Panaeolus papilionaceus]|nr:hypothetical protein BJ165DRAFT_1534870 [Panaeolus papilionaceus]